MIVVPFDPDLDTAKATAFRAAYSIDERVVLVGPFSDGPLGDDTGRVRLQRPDAPPPGEPGLYPQVTEDEVQYESASPWPVGPAGGGESLQRMGLDLFGNDSSSWVGASRPVEVWIMSSGPDVFGRGIPQVVRCRKILMVIRLPMVRRLLWG